MATHTPMGGKIDEYNWFDMPNTTADTLEARGGRVGGMGATAPGTSGSCVAPVLGLSESLGTLVELTPAQQEKAIRKERRRVEREARHAVKDRRKDYAIADILATRTKLRKQYRLV